MSVGDLNSNAPGSGARFNDGKPRLDLILWSDWNTYVSTRKCQNALKWLGAFQESGNSLFLHSVLAELYEGEPASTILVEMAAVFEYGAKVKYKPWNWAKGMPWSVPVGCIARHILKIDGGEIDDVESKLPHRAHVACNVAMLLRYMGKYLEGNDLPFKILAAA